MSRHGGASTFVGKGGGDVSKDALWTDAPNIPQGNSNNKSPENVLSTRQGGRPSMLTHGGPKSAKLGHTRLTFHQCLPKSVNIGPMFATVWTMWSTVAAAACEFLKHCRGELRSRDVGVSSRRPSRGGHGEWYVVEYLLNITTFEQLHGDLLFSIVPGGSSRPCML